VYSKVGMTVDVKIHRHVESDPTPAATLSTLFCQLRQFAKVGNSVCIFRGLFFQYAV